MTTTSTTLADRSQRLAALGLALVFALPGCMTTGLWRDDRSNDEKAHVDSKHVRAHWSADGKRMHVYVPAHAAEHFHPGATGGKDAFWLTVTPREHTTTAFVLTTVDRPSDEQVARTWPAVRLVRTLDGGAVHWSITAYAMFPTNEPMQSLTRMPGWSHALGVYPSGSFAAACDVVESPQVPQAQLDRPVREFALLSQVKRDNGAPLATKVLLTPLAVAWDVVFSPIELLMWLTL